MVVKFDQHTDFYKMQETHKTGNSVDNLEVESVSHSTIVHTILYVHTPPVVGCERMSRGATII